MKNYLKFFSVLIAVMLFLTVVVTGQSNQPFAKKFLSHNQESGNEQNFVKKGGVHVTNYGSPAFNNPNYYYAVVKTAPSDVWYRQAGLSPDGTKIVAQKSYTDGAISRTEIVLMNSNGTAETIISAGNSGVGDIYGYMNPFWSDDGTVIGYAEVHNTNPSKIVGYNLATAISNYIYEPVAPNDANNADFLGSSKTSIVFWDAPPNMTGSADLYIWDGTTRTNITNSVDYKEYEPVSNAAGDKIVYWSGETVAEPINTTHTLTYSGGVWTKDVGFTPIADSYWPYWSTRGDNYIGVTVTSSKDVLIYNSNGSAAFDLTGPGYSGGADQWNFFNTGFEGPNGEMLITSNAGRVNPGRDIVFATPRTNLFVNASSGNDLFPGTQNAPFATIGKAVTEALSGGTINVAAGAYGEVVTVNKALTIIGTGSPSTTKFVLTASPVTITGFAAGSTATVDVQPGGSIQTALSIVSPGGTVNVAAGTYAAFTITSPITLNGSGLVIVNSGSPAMTVSSTGVTINGFTFTFNSASFAIDVTAGAYNVTIINCNFQNTNGGVGNGVRNQGTGTVDARRNYWNASSGPTIASNPAGTGAIAANTSSGTLIYFPWWTDLAHTTFPVLALTSPVNGLTGVSVLPTCSWGSFGGVVSYKLYVDDANDGWVTPLYAVNQGTNLSKLFDAAVTNFPLTNGNTYYWKVAALDVDGNEYPSNTYHFTTTSASVYLSSPSDGSTVYYSPATFTWYTGTSTSGLRFIVQYKYAAAPPANAEDEAFWSGAGFTSLAPTTSLTTTGTLLYGKTYYWRVLIQRTAAPNDYVFYPMANVYNTFTTAGGSTVTIYPSWPTGNATVYTNTPTVYWYLDQYATGLTYVVRYSQHSDVNGSGMLNNIDALELASTSNLYKTFTTLNSGTQYFWQVQATYTADASTSAWSSVVSFTTNIPSTLVIPIPSYPTGGVTVYTTSPTLYWYLSTASSGLYYEIEYDLLANPFTNAADVTTTSTDQLFKQISGLTPGATYHYQIRSKNAAGLNVGPHSAWSSAETFVVAGGTTASYPVSTWPLSNATVYTERPTLYWYLEGSSLGITGYTIKYKKDSAPGSWSGFSPGGPNATEGSYTVVGATTLTKLITVDLTFGGHYYWAVAATGGTTYSEGEFTVVGGSNGVSVILSQPYDGATVYSTSVTLYWYVNGSTSGLQSYTLRYSQSDLHTPYNEVTSIANQYRTISGLTNGATYYWSVAAVYNDGTVWASPWYSFTVNTGSPSIVQPLVGSPQNVTVNTLSPKLSWVLPAPTAANTTYELQLAENPNFQDAKTFSSAKSNMQVDGLVGGKSYFWKVRSKGSNGNTSYYSGTGQFKVNSSVTEVEDKGVIPTQFDLSQNYPNPFNPTTRITYSLPQNSYVTIKIFDMLGQEIRTLVNNEMNAGKYSIDWNADNDLGNKVTSGMYIYRITAGNFVSTKKMVLIK